MKVDIENLWKKLNSSAEKEHGAFGFSTLDEEEMKSTLKRVLEKEMKKSKSKLKS